MWLSCVTQKRTLVGSSASSLCSTGVDVPEKLRFAQADLDKIGLPHSINAKLQFIGRECMALAHRKRVGLADVRKKKYCLQENERTEMRGSSKKGVFELQLWGW